MIREFKNDKKHYNEKFRSFKDINSTVAKKGVSVYWMNDPWWCNMVRISKSCLNEVIIISLQEVIKRPLMGNIPMI